MARRGPADKSRCGHDPKVGLLVTMGSAALLRNPRLLAEHRCVI
jgi:hypothetical protein